jgi:mannose-6-phosphate isomerase-like protein (cupin superfamily)
VYVVLRGEGWFVNGTARHRFGPGDLLFMPAGIEHRSEDYTDDLAAWVIFYGPDGGEQEEAGR